MTIAAIWALYLLGGVLMFFYFDHKNMHEEVPYGSISAVAPLRTLRFAAFVLFLLFWLPAIATSLALEVRARIRTHRKRDKWQRELDDINRRWKRIVAEKRQP